MGKHILMFVDVVSHCILLLVLGIFGYRWYYCLLNTHFTFNNVTQQATIYRIDWNWNDVILRNFQFLLPNMAIWKWFRIALPCVPLWSHMLCTNGMARHAHSMWESRRNNNYCDFTFRMHYGCTKWQWAGAMSMPCTRVALTIKYAFWK